MNTNGTLKIVKHNLNKYILFKEKNYYLTWASSKIIKKQRDKYDFFIYQEDDILIPKMHSTIGKKTNLNV